MSSDLWAAFGASSEDPAANPWAQPSSQSAEGQIPNTTRERGQIKPQPVDSFTWKQPELELRPESQSQTPWDDAVDLNHAANLKSTTAYEDPWSTFDKPKENTWSIEESEASHIEPWPSSEELLDPTSAVDHIPKVTDEEDDFGDFEEPEQQLSYSTKILSIVASSDRTDKSTQKVDAVASSVGGRISRPQHRRSQSVQQYDPYNDLDLLGKPKSTTIDIKKIDSIKAPDFKPTKRIGRSTALVEELVPYSTDEWGEFSPEPAKSPHFARETNKPTNIRHKTHQQVAQHARSHSEPPKHKESQARTKDPANESIPAPLPPTNVPPPSILMSLVTSLIQKLPSQVEAAMQTPTTSSKALERALRRCSASLRVAARITAGRKARWKRDTHLSQSMKIGPAGKSGGMKLTGVDRSELKREDREAAELVRIWQQKLGSIRSALATVNGQIAGRPLALPDISEAMVVRVLKLGDGGIAAPKCCALCGLKRDERVEKVDVDVWDSFGEFWTEFWGHAECRGFWEEHERYLQRR